jgi:hypothetical protein
MLEKVVADFIQDALDRGVVELVSASQQIGPASPKAPAESLNSKNTAQNKIRATLDRDKLTGQILGPDSINWIERGRNPGGKLPPTAPLIDWMRRQGIAPGEENKAVWGIRKNIVKRGIKPRPFVRAALTDAGLISISANAQTLAGLVAVELGKDIVKDLPK